MPPKRAKPAKERVQDPAEMLRQDFIRHCVVRHPQMRFRTPNEHTQDHRLNAGTLDHIHEPADVADSDNPTGREGSDA
jgi:hypothetical protein